MEDVTFSQIVQILQEILVVLVMKDIMEVDLIVKVVLFQNHKINK